MIEEKFCIQEIQHEPFVSSREADGKKSTQRNKIGSFLGHGKRTLTQKISGRRRDAAMKMKADIIHKE